MNLSDAEAAELLASMQQALDELNECRRLLALARDAIDDRDTIIEGLRATVALAEQRADGSDDALIATEQRYEAELARLCAVYMATVLP